MEMNRRIKSAFVVSVLLLTAGYFPVAAQDAGDIDERDVITIENQYSGFGRIVACDNFDLALVNSDECMVTMSADKEIFQYVHVYVKDSTLYLELDDAAFPPELKKSFSGRNAVVPVLKAEIHVGSLSSLVLHDNVVLDNSDVFSADSLFLSMDGSSMISNLSLNCGSLSMNATRNARANLSVRADSLYVRSSAASELEIAAESGTASFESAGNSSVSVSGDFAECSFFSESAGDFIVKGSAALCYVTGRGTSRIDAADFITRKASVALSMASYCSVNASELIRADIIGGSHLVYGGGPSVDIVRILSSSVTKAEEDAGK